MSKTLKRKRSDKSQSLSQRTKLHKAARLGPIVGGDALRWKEVTLPDRLDDAEGFYGLEEIDDVELVKDKDGQITFRPKTAADVIVGEGEVAGEEWGGFDDDKNVGDDTNVQMVGKEKDDSTTHSSSNVSDQPVASKAPKAKVKKEKKNAIKAPAKKPISDATGSPDVEDEIDFNALDEAEERAQADITAWRALDLSPDLLSAISSLGFSDPTPIQSAAIPPIREGRDVIGKAVTGSGKTLAFGIPIVEKWLELRSRQKNESNVPTAFILAPTRELAHQLSTHLIALSKGLEQSPRIATVTGGLALVKQQRQLEHADIIIGTPGRLWEVINNSHGLIERLKQVHFLVIDEADRLLSEGHFKEVEEILDVLNRKVIDETGDYEEGGKDKPLPKKKTHNHRQTLVFSATFHKGLQQKLASKQKWQPDDLLSNSQSLEYLLRKLRFQHGIKPTFVDANPTSSMAENLSEGILECGAMQKDLYLYSLLLLHQHQHAAHLRTNPESSTTRTLIFTNSISTVKRLVPLLTSLSIPNTQVLPLHSSMPQKSRLRSLERFTTPPSKSDTTAILIATDVAARGLDIKNVSTIIHYHVPRTADMYVHRSGRTARASTSGRSILICSPDEVAGVTRLISKIHQPQSQTPTPKSKSRAKAKGHIKPLYLPASLPSQLSSRITLAQKITDTTLSTTQAKGEDSWLRNAAAELGVDYSSDEFEENSKRGRRGRGGGREQRKKEAVAVSARGDVRGWREELKEEIRSRRVDFGDKEGVGGRYLAGGAVDVERLLREGVGS